VAIRPQAPPKAVAAKATISKTVRNRSATKESAATADLLAAAGPTRNTPISHALRLMRAASAEIVATLHPIMAACGLLHDMIVARWTKWMTQRFGAQPNSGTLRFVASASESPRHANHRVECQSQRLRNCADAMFELFAVFELLEGFGMTRMTRETIFHAKHHGLRNFSIQVPFT